MEATVILRRPKPGFKYRRSWGTVKDVGPVVGEPRLQLDRFFRPYETDVVGTEMLKRAEALGHLAGQSHAERLLDNQEDIRSQLRRYKLIFAGTVRRDPRISRRGLCVPYMFWQGGGQEWLLVHSLLKEKFRNYCRLVRLAT